MSFLFPWQTLERPNTRNFLDKIGAHRKIIEFKSTICGRKIEVCRCVVKTFRILCKSLCSLSQGWSCCKSVQLPKVARKWEWTALETEKSNDANVLKLTLHINPNPSEWLITTINLTKWRRLNYSHFSLNWKLKFQTKLRNNFRFYAVYARVAMRCAFGKSCKEKKGMRKRTSRHTGKLSLWGKLEIDQAK